MTRKWRKSISLLLALCLLVGLLPAASAAEAQAGLENFTQRNTYAPGQFDDVIGLGTHRVVPLW